MMNRRRHLLRRSIFRKILYIRRDCSHRRIRLRNNISGRHRRVVQCYPRYCRSAILSVAVLAAIALIVKVDIATTNLVVVVIFAATLILRSSPLLLTPKFVCKLYVFVVC